MKPIIAITMGDAAGVGPEVVVKALADRATTAAADLLVIGDLGRLQQAADLVGSALRLRRVGDPAEARFEDGCVDVLDIPSVPSDLPWGELSAAAGEGAFRFIEAAVSLATAGRVDAICTAPLNKAALHLAGHEYPGHTELLAALSGTDEVWMMLTAPTMRVIHVTTHVGLLDAVALLDPDRVYRTIAAGHALLVRSGTAALRIGVCAVNPHAGENGLFGHGEEAARIQPGVDRARAEGMDVQGPLPADTLFFRAARGDFDLVVAQYHDQGHIPIKVLGLKNGVNVTVGLPFVRTSVDHGTAFDIAGTGVVDHEPMIEAIRQAVALAPGRTAAIDA